MNDEDLFVEKMNDLIAKHGTIKLDVSVTLFVSILGALQLSLRHPGFPEQTHAHVREFVDRSIATLDRSAPGFGRLLKKGDDPSCDVEKESQG